MENVKEYVEMFSTTDSPVPFNNLLIYPVLVKDVYIFNMTYDVLTIEKNRIPDIKIIQMSYLDYLFNYVFNDTTQITEYETLGQINSNRFLQLMTLCLKLEQNDIKYAQTDKGIDMRIKDIPISSVDFDTMCKIIAYQNIYDFDDVKMSDDFKRAYEEYNAVKNKDIVPPTLEQRMAIVSSVSGISKKDILEMTYREFENVYNMSVRRVDYQVNKTAELTGRVKFDKPIEHWVYRSKRDKYMDSFVALDKVKDKISKVN